MGTASISSEKIYNHPVVSGVLVQPNCDGPTTQLLLPPLPYSPIYTRRRYIYCIDVLYWLLTMFRLFD